MSDLPRAIPADSGAALMQQTTAQIALHLKCIFTLTKSRQTPLPPGTTITSDSNQTYRIEELLTHGGKSGLHQYIIKNNIPGDFQHQLNIQNQLSSCPNIRTFVDSVRETEKNPTTTNNNKEPSITSIQISDLEDTVIVPPGKWLRGPLCGNALWRSAESCMVYVMANEMVLRVPDEQYILRLQLPYFADVEGVERFLEHIGAQNSFFDRILELINTFGPENPRQPVECRGFLEPGLRDLVARMTYLDPRGRITLKEALEQPWFG
ncbi:uncharacterized protein BO88DRAFT_439854 [Aspergillus vadensis CBS 113365]|uniref:Protein kinase domain-containing protein n=1 Tax=Aspergillus vadensis (strain CBS 113365 / IMI 142717 / IBT 24658) TaxID=1448311 RepID=A0A319D2M1_ASPVC|nr:hypothetical protein BO88DRAFT_439854 [Aspergillus vadensis CBS 113365]PYH74362.1 hypothetical protein BO88DRAFT_439854 [Aspergillus vadensis CBS 113365]